MPSLLGMLVYKLVTSKVAFMEYNPLSYVNLIYHLQTLWHSLCWPSQKSNFNQITGPLSRHKNKNDTTVARHFNKSQTEKPSLFEGISIYVLSFMHHPSDSIESQRERDLEEKRWMQGLSSIVPQGLNLMD